MLRCLKCENSIDMYLFRGVRHRCRWVVLIVTWVALVLLGYSWSDGVRAALQPPPPPDQNLAHFRGSTDLKHYMDHIEVLIEPSSPCANSPTPLVLVSSAPSHVEHRDVIRSTWAKHLDTYFILGVAGDEPSKMVDNYLEAKQHSDMIVFNLRDHYQNLTLKTALMLHWTLRNCPQASWLMKTDDDVLVNPWTLRKLMDEHKEEQLVGYRITGSSLHRDEYNKWFVPRWLHSDDSIPEYLSGTGYLINGKYLKSILDTALRTPLMNLEDVYLTYLVAQQKLKYTIKHDPRLSPFKPWLSFRCGYFYLASSHSYTPAEMYSAWKKIDGVSEQDGACDFYNTFVCKSCL